MKKYIFGLLTLLIIGCGGASTSDPWASLPIDSNELTFKKGDCLAFKIDSLTYGVGIVFDYSKDEGGLWYSLLFTDYESQVKPELKSIKNKRFLGRKVQSSGNDRGYVIMLDGEYVLDSLILKTDNFFLVGNLKLNEEARLGAYGASSKISGLIQSFKRGQEDRKSPPDDYRDQMKKLNDFRPDEYFDLKDFLEE